MSDKVSEQRDPLHKAGFDHPCRQTCSGWKQGFDRGFDVAADKIADLEAKLQAATRKVEKLVIENRELDYKMCPGCGMETMNGAYTEKLESLHAENQKLKALLGEAMRILEMVDLTDYELGLLRELEVKLQEASK